MERHDADAGGLPGREAGRSLVRKLAGLMTLILVALLLAACGSDDDNGDATEEATTVADIATEATTEEATETEAVETETTEATEETLGGVTESSPVAAGTGGMASPAASGLPATPAGAPAASPVAIAATPAAATPATDAAIAPVAATDAGAEASPAAADVVLTGRVELPGAPNEAWVMTNEGCVGLGANTSLKPGQQLVVRDAEGAIVGVTMLAASDETDACSWDFSVTVPNSPFYEVSVPMAIEHVFTQEDVEQSDGELVIPAA